MSYLMAVRLFKAIENKVPRHLHTLCFVETFGCKKSWKMRTFNPLCLNQHRQVTTHSTPGFINKQPSLVKKLAKKLGVSLFSKSHLRASGYQLYETVADQIDYAYFFKEFSLPDTFNSWFLVTELHVWMLMVRCMAEEENGRITRNCIVEALWLDVSLKAKQLGNEHASTARQQINEMSEQFQASLLTYDEGLQSNDKILAGAIWRRFFSKQCDDPVLLENLIGYIRKQVSFLDNLENEQFFKRKFTWPPFYSNK